MTEAIHPWEDRCFAGYTQQEQVNAMQAEITELRARVAQQAAMVEKCMVAMNENADRGMAAEARVAELSVEPIVVANTENRYAPYGIIDPDYARVYTQARIIAWQYGYACLLHGSFTRDLDLLMAPWTEHAHGNGEQILKIIAQACNLRFSDGEEDVIKSKADWTDKPHGRKSCSLYFPRFGDRRWIDISFVPVTHPRQPMSDKEIAAAWIRINDPLGLGGKFESSDHVREFVRAVEAFHGIGAKK